jgi:sugar-specific transcriptional regulator TrmB
MPKTTAVLDDARQLISRRLEELNEEQHKLERALAALGGKATGRQPGRRRGSKAKAATKPAGRGGGKRRGRRSGGRADQAAALVEKSPGVGASEIARKLKIKPNYLYRVLGDLEKEGRVEKDGRRYFPGKS